MRDPHWGRIDFADFYRATNLSDSDLLEWVKSFRDTLFFGSGSNELAQKIRSEADELRAKRASAGSKGGRTKWEKNNAKTAETWQSYDFANSKSIAMLGFCYKQQLFEENPALALDQLREFNTKIESASIIEKSKLQIETNLNGNAMILLLAKRWQRTEQNNNINTLNTSVVRRVSEIANKKSEQNFCYDSSPVSEEKIISFESKGKLTLQQRIAISYHWSHYADLFDEFDSVFDGDFEKWAFEVEIICGLKHHRFFAFYRYAKKGLEEIAKFA